MKWKEIMFQTSTKIKKEVITDNCFKSYMDANNARGIRSVLIVDNSLSSFKTKMLSNANGYLLEKIVREIFPESNISNEVVYEVLSYIPTCFIINGICLICNDWKENNNYTEKEAVTFQCRIENIIIQRPEIACKKVLYYLHYFL